MTACHIQGCGAGVDFWKDDWRRRSIYQLQVDRFNTLEPEENQCTSLVDLTQYCGGTWAGLESKLDYLKGMNFEAIMLSPTIEQTPGSHANIGIGSFRKCNPAAKLRRISSFTAFAKEKKKGKSCRLSIKCFEEENSLGQNGCQI